MAVQTCFDCVATRLDGVTVTVNVFEAELGPWVRANRLEDH